MPQVFADVWSDFDSTPDAREHVVRTVAPAVTIVLELEAPITWNVVCEPGELDRLEAWLESDPKASLLWQALFDATDAGDDEGRRELEEFDRGAWTDRLYPELAAERQRHERSYRASIAALREEA